MPTFGGHAVAFRVVEELSVEDGAMLQRNRIFRVTDLVMARA